MTRAGATLLSRPPLRQIGAAIFIITLVVFTSAGVGAAARAHILVPTALPFAALLILVLRRLSPAAERSGWAVFTVWLGTTYLQTGTSAETAAALLNLGLAFGGVFASPWLLVVAWAFHPAWDLLPRTLPALLVDLPMACLLFDGLIALYLAWAIRRGRWR